MKPGRLAAHIDAEIAKKTYDTHIPLSKKVLNEAVKYLEELEGLAELRKIYPAEFREFFIAMVREMRYHKREKGDSWKSDEFVRFYYARYSSLPPAKVMGDTDEYLDILLEKAAAEYSETKESNQLVDVANFCGMRWVRNMVFHPVRVLDNIEKVDQEATE